MSASAAPIVTQPDLRILILDGSRDEAEAIERALCAAGLSFIAVHAGSREDLVRALRERQPDVVIAAEVAGLNGYDTIKLVRRKVRDVPIILLTGSVDEKTAAKIARAGAFDYVSRDDLARLVFSVEHLRAQAEAVHDRKPDHGLVSNAVILAAEHETSPDGILVVDGDMRIVSVNRNFVEMWGLPSELVALRDDQVVLDAVAAKVADREGFLARVQYLYRHPDEKSVDELELKGGRTFYRYTSPIGQDGRYIGRVWFFHDITKEKTAEQEIREGATQFQALMEQDLMGVVIVYSDGRLAYVNPRFASLLGYTIEEGVGHPVLDFVATASKAQIARHIEELVTGKQEYVRSRASLQKKDGMVVDCILHGRLASYEHRAAIIVIIVDISELTRTQAALERANRILRILSAVNSALVRATAEAGLLESMCRAVIDSGSYQLVWVGFAEHDQASTVRPAAWAGHGEGFIESLAVSWADEAHDVGPAGTAIKTGKTVIYRNFATDPSTKPWREKALKSGFGSGIALPLKRDDKAFGAITIYAAEPDVFDDEEVKLLEQLAGDLSYGIISLRSRIAQEKSEQRLRQGVQATVLAIANTLELRDPYTAGHQRAVAKLSAAIAREIGIPDDDIEGIYLAAVVHDIGKIQVPAEILTKPGKLSNLEYQLAQTHPQAGYDIVKGVEFPWPVAEMILQHHERLDGSGYPNGLKADQILIGAKIIAVADVVQAMMASRPYRGALGLDAALAEIERGRGTKYYPPAVDACLALFRTKGFKLEPETIHEKV